MQSYGRNITEPFRWYDKEITMLLQRNDSLTGHAFSKEFNASQLT